MAKGQISKHEGPTGTTGKPGLGHNDPYCHGGQMSGGKTDGTKGGKKY